MYRRALIELRIKLHRIQCDFSQAESNGKNVLLIAYKITVGQGSEPGAGWASLLGHLKCGSSVHLISTAENIKKLTLPSTYLDQVDCSSIDLDEKSLRFLRKLPFSEQITYFFWNYKARKYVVPKLASDNFDIVHHSTFAGDWNPSFLLWNLSGNLYWGPIGGTQKVPIKAYRWLGLKGFLSEILRILITSPLRFLNRNLAKKNNVHVLVANRTTSEYFSKKCKVSNANQIVLEHASPSGNSEDTSIPKMLLGSGRLISWKMWPLAIKSVSLAESNFFNFSIYGEGGQRKKLNKLITKLGAKNYMTINALIPRERLLTLLKKSGVYVFPSLKDSCPWSLAEAVHLGVPIAAFNVSGVSEMVSDPDSNLASISGNLVTNLAEKILDPYRVTEKNSFCECKIKRQYKEIFYAE